VSRLSIQQLVLLACLVAVAPDCQPQVTKAANVHEIAKRVDEYYNHLASLRADFEERYQGAGVERTENGLLWLKRPGKMRGKSLKHQQKLLISNGREANFSFPGKSRPRRADEKTSTISIRRSVICWEKPDLKRSSRACAWDPPARCNREMWFW